MIIYHTVPEIWHVMDVQSNLYKTTTLGTTQKWLSWSGGLIRHLHKKDHNPNLVVLGRLLVFILTVNVL